MADKKYISLKVSGNPESNGGFGPLISFNSPSFDVADTVYSGFNNCSYFFSIRIEKNQVVYKLIKNNVSSYGAIRQGSLVIAFSIPKGYKIDGEYGPYDILEKLKNRFLSKCMTCKDQTTKRYEYNKGIVDSNILDDTAKEFTLVESLSSYHPMTTGAPIGYVIADEDKIAALLKDVQYPVFSNFSEILVAENTQGTNYVPIPNLQIPRMKEYAIIVDGEQKLIVSDVNQPLTCSSNEDNNFYENGQITFTIAELKNGNYLPDVCLDEERETISVSTKTLYKERSKIIRLVILPKEHEEYFFANEGVLNITCDNKYAIPISDDLSFTLRGEEIGLLINGSSFVPTLNKTDKYRIVKSALLGNELKIDTEKVLPRQEPIERKITQRERQETVKNKASDVSEINFSFLEDTFPHKYNRIRSLYVSICVYDQYDKFTLFLREKVILEYVDGKMNGKIFIPSHRWSANELFVNFTVDAFKYTSCPVRFKAHDPVNLTIKDFERKQMSSWEKAGNVRKTLLIILLSLMFGLIAGCTIGYWGHDPLIELLGKWSKTYKCEECNMLFSSQKELDNHILKHNSSFKCDRCGKAFSNKNDLKTHITKEHPLFICDKCKKEFDSDNDLQTHITNEHPHFICDKCKKEFDSEDALQTHTKSEHPLFQCIKCGRKFNSQNELKAHANREHSLFACDKCNLKFNSQNELDSHKKRKHEER